MLLLQPPKVEFREDPGHVSQTAHGQIYRSPGDAAIFLTLDDNSIYWHVEIALEVRKKTSVTSRYRLSSFTHTPFGLENHPGTFHRAMTSVLTKGRMQFALVYLDDIVIFSRTPDEKMDHV